MTYPWETTPLQDYITFMDRHVRVEVFISGKLKGSFSIVDNGTKLETGFGTLEIKVRGHPHTNDPIMTAEELANYVLTEFGN